MTGRNSEVDLSICNVPLPCPFFEGGFDDSYRYQGFDAINVTNDCEDLTGRGRISSYTLSSLTQRDDSLQTLPAGLGPDKNDVTRTKFKAPHPNNSHLYFHYIQLFLISQDVTKNLYMLDSPWRRWSDIEDSICTLWDLTVRWLHQLPHEYSFSRPVVPVESDALSLGCLFYSIRIMITRPCLCRHDRRRMENSKIALFHKNMAEDCVKSAKAIVGLFPDDFNVPRLFEASTWWQFVHFLVQAIIVLLIEMKFWAQSGTTSYNELIRAIKKGLLSIWLLSKSDTSALRAWNLCGALFRRIAAEQHINVTDLTDGGLQSDSRRSEPPSPGESLTPTDSAIDVNDIVSSVHLCTPFDEVPVYRTLLPTEI